MTTQIRISDALDAKLREHSERLNLPRETIIAGLIERGLEPSPEPDSRERESCCRFELNDMPLNLKGWLAEFQPSGAVKELSEQPVLAFIQTKRTGGGVAYVSYQGGKWVVQQGRRVVTFTRGRVVHVIPVRNIRAPEAAA